MLVVCSLDSYGVPRRAPPRLDLPELGLDWNDRFTVHDEITGNSFEWGQYNYVRLEPWTNVAHILRVER